MGKDGLTGRQLLILQWASLSLLSLLVPLKRFQVSGLLIRFGENARFVLVNYGHSLVN